MDFSEWLDETLELQRTAFNVDPPKLSDSSRAEYWRWNVLAAIKELTEFLDEVRWKPWALDMGRILDRDAAVEELVDVLHFIANLACTLEVTGEELSRIYLAKMQVNRDRQESGSYLG